MCLAADKRVPGLGVHVGWCPGSADPALNLDREVLTSNELLHIRQLSMQGNTYSLIGYHDMFIRGFKDMLRIEAQTSRHPD